MTYTPNPELNKKIAAGLRAGLVAFQLVQSRSLRALLSKPGTGRDYRISAGKKSGRNKRARGIHRASAPGFPPAVNTNRLRASWAVAAGGTTVNRTDGFLNFFSTGTTMRYVFGSNVPYAPMLEYGTRNMKRRPYLKPMMDDTTKRAVAIFAQKVKEAISG